MAVADVHVQYMINGRGRLTKPAALSLSLVWESSTGRILSYYYYLQSFSTVP
jgi:hypothetical protein